MELRRRIYSLLLVLLVMSMAGYAFTLPYWQGRVVQRVQQQTPQKPQKRNKKDTVQVKVQPEIEDETHIPDSLLHPRWKIQRTTPVIFDDLE